MSFRCKNRGYHFPKLNLTTILKHLKIRDAILSHTDLMGTLSTPMAPIVNTITGLKPVRKILDKGLKSTIVVNYPNTLWYI